LTIQVLIVRSRSRRAIAMLPAGQILAIEEEGIAFFELEFISCRCGPGAGQQHERQQLESVTPHGGSSINVMGARLQFLILQILGSCRPEIKLLTQATASSPRSQMQLARKIMPSMRLSSSQRQPRAHWCCIAGSGIGCFAP